MFQKLFDKMLNIRRDSMGRNVDVVIAKLQLQYQGSWSYVAEKAWYEDCNSGYILKCYEIK